MFKKFMNRPPEFEKNIPVSAFVLYKREASWLIVAALFLILLSFLAGYFIGQRKVVRSFVQQTSEQALLEQFQPEPMQPEQTQESKGQDEQQLEQAAKTEVTSIKTESIDKYVAPVAVNDKYDRAVRLVDLAHKQGIELRIKKSSRKLKSGKRKITYQIVTAPYDNQEALKHDLEVLKSLPQFKEISIKINRINQRD